MPSLLRSAALSLSAATLAACMSSAPPPPVVPAAAPAAPPAPIMATYACSDGSTVAATFSGDTATLQGAGGPAALQRAMSADGGRYTNALGVEFWDKGNEAYYTRGPGQAAIICTKQG